MGQTSSLPVVVAHNDPKATPRPKQKDPVLKIPSAWKGSDSSEHPNQFVMISPQSDISNPSHFRGKKLHTTVNLADTSATMQRRAYRTSKVCSKVPVHLSSGVPIPSRFYFQAEEEDDKNKRPTAKRENQPMQQQHHTAPSTNNTKNKFAAKCIKAKQHLSKCWKEREENELPERLARKYSPPERITRHYSQRDHAKKKNAAVPEAQFQPVWKEKESTHHPPISQQQQGKASLETVAPIEEKARMDIIPSSLPQEKPPIVTSIRVSDIVRTFSQETANSTVLQKSTGSSTRSSVASTVLQCPPSSAAIFRPLPSENTGLPIQASTSHDTSTASSAKQGEELKQKKRASIEKQNSYSSEPSIKNRRSEISMHMQRQIDEQIMVHKVSSTNPSRVQRLRHQYQQEIEKKFLSVQEETRKQNDEVLVPIKASDRFSVPRGEVDDVSRLTVAEKRQVFEAKPRYASVPKQRVSVQPTLQTKASTAANSRSVSAPRASQLPDGSALLFLSGSWDVSNKTTAPAKTQLPVLLQMAGWKSETSRRRSTESLRHMSSHQAPSASEQQRASLSKSHSENVATKSVKNQRVSYSSSGKENQGTEVPLDVVAKPQIKNIKVRHSIHSHTKEMEKSKDTTTATQIRKAVSFDATILSKRPVTGPKGRSIAFMLQQAYFGNDDEDSEGGPGATTTNPKRGYLHHLLSPRATMKNSTTALVEASPALSVDTVQSSTNDSVPVVSDQALWNADFLFHQDGFPAADTIANGRHSNSHSSAGGYTLTTLDSRSRIVTSSVPAVVVPSSTTASMARKESDDDDVSLPRRVRFSEETVHSSSNTSVPKIETKLSDLTDDHTTKGRDSVAMSIPRIDSIPEEDEDTAKESSPTGKPPIMRWSYRTSAASSASSDLDSRGVTPLLGNKTASKVVTATTTNSPYLRFKQAKERFSSFGGGAKGVSPSKPQKIMPTKRFSPTKTIRQNLVTSRIAAMEGRRFQHCSGESTESVVSSLAEVQPLPPVVKSLARVASKSPLMKLVPRRFYPATKQLDPTFSPNIIPQNSQDEDEKKQLESSSPMLINGLVVQSPEPGQNNLPLEGDAASVVSNDDSEDVFGAILHPTTIDDDDSTSDPLEDNFSEDDDAFDRLLNYSESYEEKTKKPLSKNLQTRLSNSTQGTVIRNQLSSDTTSVASLASSSGDTATVPHWLLHQGGRSSYRSSVASGSENSSVVSAVSRMNGGITAKTLPFREVAPVQPMHLQRHRYSEDPSVVEPPRTWRAMAVAAQDRALTDRSNFQ